MMMMMGKGDSADDWWVGIEAKLYEEWLREMDVFRKGQRIKSWYDSYFKYLKDCHVEDGASLFSVAL